MIIIMRVYTKFLKKNRAVKIDSVIVYIIKSSTLSISSFDMLY